MVFSPLSLSLYVRAHFASQPKKNPFFINLWIFIYDFSMLIIIMAFVLVISLTQPAL